MAKKKTKSFINNYCLVVNMNMEDVVKGIYPTIETKLDGGTNGTYSMVFADEYFVYKVIYPRNDYKGIKSPKDAFKREIHNTKLLEEFGLNVPRIIQTRKVKTPEGEIYIIKKEKINGYNLEEYLKKEDVPFNKKQNVVCKAVDYILKLQSIPANKVKQHKGLENLVTKRNLKSHKTGEQTTIIFDSRLSNFVYNPETDEIYLVDTETITKGNPYWDIGWFIADLSEIAIKNPKLLEIEKYILLKTLIKYPKELSKAIEEINAYKNNYFKMPRESGLEAYNISFEQTDFQKGIVVVPLSTEEIQEIAYKGEPTSEDTIVSDEIKLSVPKGIAVMPIEVSSSIEFFQ